MEITSSDIITDGLTATRYAATLDAQGGHIVWDAYSWHKTVDAGRAARVVTQAITL